MRAPRALVTGNATGSGVEQRRNLVHTPLARDFGGSRAILLAAERRIGAVLQKDLCDLQRLSLILRQPEERSCLP